MELIDKYNSLIERLEEILHLDNPDINNLRKLIEDIENEELMQLEEEVDKYYDQFCDGKEPDKSELKFLSQIENMTDKTYELISVIREKFGLEYMDEDEFENVDDEEIDDDSFGQLCSPWNSEDNESEQGQYTIVLNVIAKSALKKIDVGSDDTIIMNLLEHVMEIILAGILTKEKESLTVAKAFSDVMLTGYYIPKEKIADMCKQVSEKCHMQLMGLEIAVGSLQNYHCGAEAALSQIAMIL